MSIRRLLLTAAAMGGVAVALTALTPAFPAMVEALTDAQRTVDRDGADTLVLAGAGLLAWLCWAWGALGLTLTAASAIPGLIGFGARAALHVVLPAGARRSAALLVGLGLGVTGPVLVTALPHAPVASADVGNPTAGPSDRLGAARADRSGIALAGSAGTGVPDWSAPVRTGGAGDAVPDWPEAPSNDATTDTTTDAAPDTTNTAAPDTAPAHPLGSHVVVRGDCLWSIAEAHLRQEQGRAPSTNEVAVAVHGWWRTNQSVIGPDPDRLLPGQVLQPPP